MAQVFTARTTDGNSSVVDFAGGKIDIAVGGTFNGCTVELQAKLNKAGGSNWIPVDQAGSPCQWTQPLVKSLELNEPCQLRLVLSNDGASTSINAWI